MGRTYHKSHERGLTRLGCVPLPSYIVHDGSRREGLSRTGPACATLPE